MRFRQHAADWRQHEQVADKTEWRSTAAGGPGERSGKKRRPEYGLLELWFHKTWGLGEVDVQDQQMAMQEDRQGLGLSRRRTVKPMG